MCISLKSNILGYKIPVISTISDFHFVQIKNPAGEPQGFSKKKNVEVC